MYKIIIDYLSFANASAAIFQFYQKANAKEIRSEDGKAKWMAAHELMEANDAHITYYLQTAVIILDLFNATTYKEGIRILKMFEVEHSNNKAPKIFKK